MNRFSDASPRLPSLPESADSESQSLTSAQKLEGRSLKDVIDSYVRYYAFGDGHTAKAKRYDLKYLLEFLAGDPRRIESLSVADWTMQRTIDFIDQRLALREAPSTVSRRLATIKHLGRTLAERVHGFINPAREVKSPSVQLTRPSGLSPEESHLLRAAAKEIEGRRADFLSLRNRFLLEMLLATGLRADEVRLLKVGQISEDRQWLKNVKTKGRKFRNVYLDEELREELSEYVLHREQFMIQKLPFYDTMSSGERHRLPLFVSFHSCTIDNPQSFGMAPKTIWRVIAAFGKAAQALSAPGAPLPNLHPHMLRHTFAHGLLDTSKDVRLVAQALGHSDVRTTMRYTERSDEHIARAIEIKRTQGR